MRGTARGTSIGRRVTATGHSFEQADYINGARLLMWVTATDTATDGWSQHRNRLGQADHRNGHSLGHVGRNNEGSLGWAERALGRRVASSGTAIDTFIQFSLRTLTCMLPHCILGPILFVWWVITEEGGSSVQGGKNTCTVQATTRQCIDVSRIRRQSRQSSNTRASWMLLQEMGHRMEKIHYPPDYDVMLDR